MRSNTYTDKEMFAMASLSDTAFLATLNGKSINSCLALRKLLQMSLAQFSKRNKDMLAVQMDIVHKCQIIERYVRPHIYQKHLINIVLKYPKESENRHKELAKDKTERTLAKMSY